MNRRLIELRAAAQDDLTNHYGWLANEGGEPLAESMLASAAAEFDKLAQTVGLGSPIQTSRSDLAGLRKWRIRHFPKLLIFYQATDERLFVIRVLHSAQDWLAALEGD